MFKSSLVEFSIRRPKWVLLLAGLVTLLFLTQFPKIRTPEEIEAAATALYECVNGLLVRRS